MIFCSAGLLRGHLYQKHVKNGHLGHFMAKNLSKWTPWLFRSQKQVKTDIYLCYLVANNISKTDTCPVCESNFCQKWTPWRFLAVSRQKYVKNGHCGRFAAQTFLKNGHLGRFTAKNMSKTDILTTSRPKTCRKRTPWRSLAVLRQKHVKIGYHGRFAAQTLLKNGHLSRSAVKNM